MLAVSTNFSYLPVAEFIVQSETSSSIVEALEIIKGWNPEWSPDHFMVDYSEEEYQALQAVFPTAEKFLCAFHREQSWKRWVKNSKNGLSDEQQNMFLEMMRNVASSTHVGLAVEEVKRCRLYTENSKVRQYLDRYWLNCVQRWCDVYVKHSPSTIIPVTTTNGIEALNKSVKHSYLKLKSNGTLSTMVEILVEEFVPDIILEYRNLNYMACSQYKSYRPEIPDFLHNRPHKIVKALMKSMASADYSLPRHVHELSTTSFEVLSEDREDVWYEVKLDEPSCKCPYFKQQRLPCKHIFAILKHTDKNWEDLNEEYRKSPYLTLDTDFMDEHLLNSVTKVEEVQDDELENLINVMKRMEREERRKNIEPGNIILKKQNALREQVKLIHDMSYNITDKEALETYLSKLKVVVTQMERSVKKSNNLPLHTGPTVNIKSERQQQKMASLPTRKRSKAKRKRQDSGYESIIVDLTEDEQPAKKSRKEGFANEEKGRAVKTKHVRWADSLEDVRYFKAGETIQIDHAYISPSRSFLSGQNLNVLRAKIGPYKIKDRSLQDLQGKLPDEIMDSYLLYLTRTTMNKAIHHISSCIMTAIMEQKDDIHGHQRKVDYSHFDIIWGAYNEDECHWTLVVAYPHDKRLLYINPSGELPRRKTKVLNSWSCFMAQRSSLGCSGPVGNWTLETMPHLRQTDLTSCGVFVLKFAEYLAKNLPLMTLRHGDILEARQQIETILLENSDPLELMCHRCDAALADDGTCPSCERLLDQSPSISIPDNRTTEQGSNVCRPTFRNKRLSLSKKKKSADVTSDDVEAADNVSTITGQTNLDIECADDDQNGTKGEDNLLSFCKSNIDSAIALAYRIMKCSTDCEEVDHIRHHEFIKNYTMVCHREMSKHGFGYDIFNQKCVEWVIMELKKRLLEHYKDPMHPYSIQGQRIRGLGDCSLAVCLRENPMLVQNYLLYVVFKEVMVLLRTIKQGCPYEVANNSCQSSEIDMKAILKERGRI